MDRDALLSSGLKFTYCRNCAVPQIPTVQDVLYALHSSPNDEYYHFAVANHSSYVANVHFAATVAAADENVCHCENEEHLRRVIAHNIVLLCPPEAKCLFETAFVAAHNAAGYRSQLPTQGSRDELMGVCSCAHCKQQWASERVLVPT